ncbi:type IV pilin N-terminal domain-containing protein [Methanoregula formicica]|uniref:Archaeal Type IV pilin N-terminal domain-containing protein n=1 Tax=Methanoregula formicica (strain DSM 22288 / NBRC 105244 / SMSP) TaxID=593750 RepID=L0HFU0_METFS|nr:type IV pilin N-terminal domain-containing protein [Methanoregula formicica]AGB01959.1 hypothetical protein Metfor_0904 [Methanoregula formicica SMSP]
MTRMSNDAVSPVVGVMLMLVVTIIIAAVVSAFAGGFGGAQQITPHATVTATVVIDNVTGTSTCVNVAPFTCTRTYPDGFTAKNGIMFESTGGTPFNLNSIIVELVSDSGTTQTVRGTDKLDPDHTILPYGTANGGYFLKIGNISLSDTVISPGDRFMFYADECYDVSSGGKSRTLMWGPKGINGGHMYLSANSRTQWYILDINTQRAIANGQLLMPVW